MKEGVMVEVMRLSRRPRGQPGLGFFEPTEGEEESASEAAENEAPEQKEDYTQSKAWSLADMLHSLLPESLSARKGVLQKRSRLQRLERETQE